MIGRMRQFACFLAVGVTNTIVSLIAFWLLVAAGTPYAAAAPLAFATGALNGYVLNRRWTFAARDTKRARLLYVVVQVAGAAATSLLVVVLVDAGGVNQTIAYLASVPPVTVGMFAANRFWTFGGDAGSPAGPCA